MIYPDCCRRVTVRIIRNIYTDFQCARVSPETWRIEMKRFLIGVGAGLMAVAIASPSFAADLPRPAYKAPIYVAGFSWTGFYVGINGGYGFAKSSWTNAAIS